MTSPRSARGFSLIEVLVALVVFGIAVALLLPSFAYFSRINSVQEDRSGGVRAVEGVIDELRAAAAGDVFAEPPWPEGPGETKAELEPVANGFGSFEVRYWYCAEGDTDCLTSTNARHLFATVTAEGRVVYELETIITRFEDGG